MLSVKSESLENESLKNESLKIKSLENRVAFSTGKGIGGGTSSVSRSIGYPNINLEDIHFEDWEECK